MKSIVEEDENIKDSKNKEDSNNDLEHTFAFLAFKCTQAERDELYLRTEPFPLLRHRVLGYVLCMPNYIIAKE